jgi:polyisoprenoid-binding protein YceI
MLKQFFNLPCLLLLNSFIFASDWQVNKQADNNLVVFQSTTTLLDFEGTTNNIDGYIYWQGEDILPAGSELYFEVQPATFETGIGKRDSDMRSDVLETNKYTLSSFKGTLSKVEKSEAGIFDVIATGKFDLHGVKKEMEIPASITLLENQLHVKAEFSIFLKDYNIKAPSLMAFVKVAEEIKLKVNFVLEEVKN